MGIASNVYRHAGHEATGLETGLHVLHELLVAVPIVVIATIGIMNRAKQDPYLFVSYSSETNAQLEAYAPILRDVKRLIPNVMTTPVGNVRKAAKEWVESARSGKLRTPRIVSYDDTVDSGARGEIFSANFRTVAAMNLGAEREAIHGDPDTAARDALLAMQTAAITEYFDLSALPREAALQRRSLDVVHRVLPRLDRPERQLIASGIADLKLRRTDLARIALDTRDAFLRHDVELNGRNGDVVQVAHQIPRTAVSTDADLPIEERRLASMIPVAGNGANSLFYTQERLGMRTVEITNRDIDRTVAALRADATARNVE
jgi:hypothetical protein